MSGTELISTLTDRLPPDLIEAGWAEARRTMARIRPRTRLAGDNAASAATAAMLCQLVVGIAAEAGNAEAVHDLTWAAVDELIAELTR